MKIMSLLKCLKFEVDSRNGNKSWEKVFGFSDNRIWLGRFRFSQPWTGYLPSDVNVLTDNPNISPDTGGDILEMSFPENDEET